jgi:hypothetical protein
VCNTAHQSFDVSLAQLVVGQIVLHGHCRHLLVNAMLVGWEMMMYLQT